MPDSSRTAASDVRDALDRLRQSFIERGDTGRRPNTAATAIWTDGLRFDVSGPAGERAVTDMPAAMGGKGRGPNPGWLLRASLASCTATVIAMKAAQRGIALDRLEVQVESESDSRGLTGIEGTDTALHNLRMRVKVASAGTDDTTLRELVASANQTSPVGATLCMPAAIVLEVTTG